MSVLYLDLASGISGDMFVGALVDLGADSDALDRELAKLALGGYHLHARRGLKGGIAGVKFDVHLDAGPGAPPVEAHAHGHAHPHSQDHGHHHGHSHSSDTSHDHARAHDPSGPPGHAGGRDFAEIRRLIVASSLSDWVKGKSIAIFSRLADAEGKIHGLPPDEVAFHEVGAVDSIVDIVGACVGLELLDKPRLLAGPVIEGTGWIDCAHGRLPIPAPATLAVLGARGIPVTQCEEPKEMVTPTGAALLAELVDEFGPMRNLVARKIGFGLGTRDHQARPNVLRAILGDLATSPAPSANHPHDWETDTVTVLETNLDDISAEVLGWLTEQALEAGALDVFHTPIQMKKSRPGVLLSILCAGGDADKFSELVLRQTTAFGVRRYQAERRKLRREFLTVATPLGDVTVKIGRLDGQTIQAAPEFESCRKVAEAGGFPLKEVYEAARNAIPVQHRPGTGWDCRERG